MSDQASRRRRGHLSSLTSCKRCGGLETRREVAHPLGGSLVTLQCSACGDELPAVKRTRKDGRVTYHKAGRPPRKRSLT